MNAVASANTLARRAIAAAAQSARGIGRIRPPSLQTQIRKKKTLAPLAHSDPSFEN